MLLPTVRFNHAEQHFEPMGGAAESVDASLASSMHLPLSLTFQLTRGCNFSCVYCSEPPGIATRPFPEMKEMLDKLKGMRRVIFSGGEPMLYKHFWEMLEYARPRFEVVVLSTNGSLIDAGAASRLKGLVDYVDVTVDGPRRQHDLVRGNYDQVMRGLMHVAVQDIPRSVICVFLEGKNHDVMHYICQQADAIGALKVKILTPIPKGHSKSLFRHFATGETITRLRDFLEDEKVRNGWRIRITITDWMRVGKGHAILLEPDGRMVASPVWDVAESSDCVLPFGNLAEEDAESLWKKYPFKDNHIRKYLENTLVII